MRERHGWYVEKGVCMQELMSKGGEGDRDERELNTSNA